MTDFTVEPKGLDRAATRFEATHARAVKAQSTLAELHIPDGTFGHVPWVSDKLREPYSKHVEACTTCVDDIVESLSDLVTAVRNTSTAYATTEGENAKQGAAITPSLYSGPTMDAVIPTEKKAL